MKVLIVYNLPSDKRTADDADVLVQVESVKDALLELGHNVNTLGIDLNLEYFVKKITERKPDLIFNLVEGISGVEKYLHFVPVILERLSFPFTGGSSESLYITTNKVLTKKILSQNELSTPKYYSVEDVISKKNDIAFPAIIKPIYSDASVGLDESSLLFESNGIEQRLMNKIEDYGECFIEEYIDGREFNISLIGTSNAPLILPYAEIKFLNFPPEKSKIVGYDAKWDKNSFEYQNTVRSFEFNKTDQSLLDNLKYLALKCWEVFRIDGYARVDFRVDSKGIPYILEINVNPCISPDSGFFAACEKHGMEYKDMINQIVQNTAVSLYQ